MAAALVALVATAALVGVAPRAHAEDWHLGVEGLTDFPLHVGGQVTLEMPTGFRVSGSLGVMPGGYVDVWNAIGVAAGGYDDAMARLVRSSLQDSLVLRLHAGWRPVHDLGFYVEAGYGLATLGGGATTADLVEAVTDEELPASQLEGGDQRFSLDTSVHMLDVELGWLFRLGGGWTIRVAIGWALTLEAQARVKPQFEPLLPTVVDDFSGHAEEVIERTFLSWIHPPTVSLALGYWFF